MRKTGKSWYISTVHCNHSTSQFVLAQYRSTLYRGINCTHTHLEKVYHLHQETKYTCAHTLILTHSLMLVCTCTYTCTHSCLYTCGESLPLQRDPTAPARTDPPRQSPLPSSHSARRTSPPPLFASGASRWLGHPGIRVSSDPRGEATSTHIGLSEVGGARRCRGRKEEVMRR